MTFRLSLRSTEYDHLDRIYIEFMKLLTNSPEKVHSNCNKMEYSPKIKLTILIDVVR